MATNTEDSNDVLQDGRYSFVNEAMLTEEQRELLYEIREKFDPVDIVADLCILYEVTGYQDESADA